MSVDAGFWTQLVLAVLATWRLTHLVAREDGPADLVVRLRSRAGSGWVGHLMDCFNCTSLWVAAPLAWWLASTWADGVVLWLALSGAACLLERTSAEKLVIQPLEPTAQGESHGMLRTEPLGDERVAGGDATIEGVAIKPARPDRVADGSVAAGLSVERRG